MTNPYETLGVREGATEEEIKASYKELVKKYHPDKYENNPLQDLADEKMREINEAYDYLVKNNQGGNNQDFYNNDQYNGNNNGYSNPVFQRIRNLINLNNLLAAEQELNSIHDKSAEWYFLRGVIFMRKGWYNEGYNDLKTAIAMEPSNNEYRSALNNATNSNNTYMNNAFSRGTRTNSDFCDTLSCLCCADQACDCMGLGCCC